MNGDEPPAQTDLHKHGMLIKDQLYNNVHLSGEMKGRLPECPPAKRSEIRYQAIYLMFLYVSKPSYF